jgi:hypothetical protein
MYTRVPENEWFRDARGNWGTQTVSSSWAGYIHVITVITANGDLPLYTSALTAIAPAMENISLLTGHWNQYQSTQQPVK